MRSPRSSIGFRRAMALVAAAFALLGAAEARDRPVAATSTLTITLAPRPAASSPAAIATLDVTLSFTGVTANPGQPVVSLPLKSSNVQTGATLITDMRASDGRGALTLVAHDRDRPVEAARDAEMGGPSREWVADRPVVGLLTIRFAVPAAFDKGNGPPFALRDDSGAVSGAGAVFLPMPPGDARYRTMIAWDLSHLPAGARGVSSFGEGRVSPVEPLTAGDLRDSFFMAGRVQTWPHVVPGNGFFAAWQGDPPFATPALMQWTARLYGRYSRFFGQATPPPYGVFLRFNPYNPGGGVGLNHSFVATYGRPGGTGSDPAQLSITLAHEMFHTFQPYIEQPAGLESSWFGEGLATLYMYRLPLRFGAITPAAFLDGINETAGRYYTNLKARVPNREVPALFWADTRVRVLPYDRGMLYFASVDDAVRKASRGKRSLDDLMFAMLARHKAGATLSNADWETLLRQELGESVVTVFRAFLDGAMPLPPWDAFGPCFRRTTRPLRRYEAGYDPVASSGSPRIVHGLIAGSAAAVAGLRDGDEIVAQAVPADILQGQQTTHQVLTVRRDGRTLTIDYLPRSETVEAYQWERVPGTPDAACAL